MITVIFIFILRIGIYTRYHPCLSHDKVFAKLLTSKAVLGKRPLEVQVHNTCKLIILHTPTTYRTNFRRM